MRMKVNTREGFMDNGLMSWPGSYFVAPSFLTKAGIADALIWSWLKGAEQPMEKTLDSKSLKFRQQTAREFFSLTLSCLVIQ